MEQGFLNKATKSSLNHADTMGSSLSDLARTVKSSNGKLLGKDGKPLKPYRCVNEKASSGTLKDGDAVTSNVSIDGDEGCSKDTSNVHVDSQVAAGTTSVDDNILTAGVGSKVSDKSVQDGMVDLSLADVVLPQDEVETISARFENSLYGYFVGQRPAFPVVQNFVRNVWKKYGLLHVMIHQGFFMFQFSSREGLENVLNQGPWRVRSVPLMLHIWNPNAALIRDDIKKIPVWVRLYNVPVVAYSLVGLKMITAKLGRIIMFDEYTSDMCLKSWGMNSYARVLVEISAENEFVDSLLVAVPIPKTKEHRMVKIDVEFEYKPPRCSLCKLFDHVEKECRNKVKKVHSKVHKDAGLGSNKHKAKAGHKVKVTITPKLMYRPVSKPNTKGHTSNSVPNDFTTPRNEEVESVVGVESKESETLDTNSKVTKEFHNEETSGPHLLQKESSQSRNEHGYFNDDIDLGELRSFLDKRYEQNKVIELASVSPNVDVVGDGLVSQIDKVDPNISTVALEERTTNVLPSELSTNDVSVVEPPVSVINEKELGSTPSSSFQPSTSASKKTNPFSKVGDIVYSDSDSEDEVLNPFDESANLLDRPMGMFSSAGGGDDQEYYDDYDDYMDQLYELPGHLKAFYDDIKLQGRTRK